MGISVFYHTGMEGWQDVNLPEVFIGQAWAMGTLGMQNKGPMISGVSEASH